MANAPSWAVPGQPVVCIAGGGWKEVSGHPNAPMVWPHRGFVYTIHSVACDDRGVYLTLVEHGTLFEYDSRGFQPVSRDEVEAELFNARLVRQPAGALT